MSSISENIAEIKKQVSAAAEKSGRRAEDILIVAATKTVSPERIQEAIDAGISAIGENRVQELCDKFGKTEGAELHLIGHLQTNKVKYIIDKVSLIHSVESIKLLNEIEKRAADLNITARVLIEVNTSGEDSKFGVSIDGVFPILEENEKNRHIKIEGLMTIGPNTTDVIKIRESFSNLKKLFLDIQAKKYNNSNMKYLSMGMSGDFAIAIEEGANIVRVGSAIFGQRNYGGL